MKTHVYQWLTHLRRLAGKEAVGVFPFLEELGECAHERSSISPPRTAARLALLAAVNYSRLPIMNWLPLRADVFHASHQLWSPPTRVRLTATVYDMTCWVVPETHPRWNVTGARRFADSVIRRAHGLIANSESARTDAARILGLAEEKLEVIYPGVTAPFFSVAAEEARTAAEKYALARPYVLHVGTIEPRKNIDTLLDAWAALPGFLREEFELVLAGPAGWAHERTLARLRSGSVAARYLGYVPETDMPGLTAGAAASVYPSLYEGFGLPVAQAMAAGVAVVTSNLSSLPEIAGNAGILIDPRSVAELRSAIQRLLESPRLRAELGAKGRERAAQFTWEAYARKSLAFFERVCGAG